MIRACHHPVVEMLLALYGHPDSGTFWEAYCDGKVKRPSVYFHDWLRLLLTIYVDVFKLAGPKGNLAEGWTLLRSCRDIGREADTGMYLGCNVIKLSFTLSTGDHVNGVVYDMEPFLEQCVARYLEVAVTGTTMKPVKHHFWCMTPTSEFRNPIVPPGRGGSSPWLG